MSRPPPPGRLALIFELMDMNIYELIRGRRHYVAEERVQHFMYQLMKALDHMHKNGIFHRCARGERVLLAGRAMWVNVCVGGARARG